MKSYMADPLNGWQENGGCSEQTEGSVQARILKARRAQKSTSVLKLGIKAREAPNIKKSCGLQQVVLNMNPRSHILDCLKHRRRGDPIKYDSDCIYQ